MPRTSGPIFTNKPAHQQLSPAPVQTVQPTKLSEEIVKRIDEREKQKERERRERLKKAAKRSAIDIIAAKILKLALRRFVFTPLAFKYFGTLTKMYTNSGGLTKLAASSTYYKLAQLVVNRLITVGTQLILEYLEQIYKKALQDKTLKSGKRFKLTVLKLKLRLAVKTGNFDSFVSFLHDSFIWPLVKQSKPFKEGVRLLKQLSDLRNPKSVSDIRKIIRVTALLAKWSKQLHNPKLQKRIQNYSVQLNKGLTSKVKSYKEFKI